MAEFGFASDGTLKELVSAAEAANAYLAAMAALQAESSDMSISTVRRIAASGGAAKVFSIGDKLTETWTDSAGGTSYDAEHLMVDFADVELKDGSSVPGLFLQWKYSTPYNMPFDAREAFYYTGEGLSAGTYCITFGGSWGKIVSGETYYFTLTEDVPQGGQLYFEANLQTTEPEGTNVIVYSSSASAAASATAQMSQSVPDGGAVSLGTMYLAKTDGNLNGIYRSIYGYNRWSQSAIRQWLNSSAAAGEWWSAQNVWDRPPAQAATYSGFMAGYGEEFLAAIQKVKVTTALNTMSDGGGSEDTYDYFFLPSIEQMYVTPQNAGVEGDYWEYWKRAAGGGETIAINTAGAFPTIYGIDSKSTVRGVNLRSCSLASVTNAYAVNTAGAIVSGFATYTYRALPACVIC